MDKFTHKVYQVTVMYDAPQGGNIRVAAETPEIARELVTKQFSRYKNFEIAQCVAEADIMPTPYSTAENAPVMVSQEPDDDETPPSQKVH